MKVETDHGSSHRSSHVPISLAKFGILNRGHFVVNFVIFFTLRPLIAQKVVTCQKKPSFGF